MNQVINNTDLLVCNDSESLAWGKNVSNNISGQLEHLQDTDLAEKSMINQELIARTLQSLPKADPRKKRAVIVTRGTKPTLLALGDSIN